MSAAIGAEIVSVFFEHYPQVKLHLVDGLSGFVNEWLAAGRIDMAVINNARKSPYIRMDPLLEVDLLLFGRKSDIDAIAPDQETFKTPDLVKLPLLLVGRNHGLRRELDGAMQRLGLELNIKAEVDALSALKKLVKGGTASRCCRMGSSCRRSAARILHFVDLLNRRSASDSCWHISLQRPTTLAEARVGATRARRTDESRRRRPDGRPYGPAPVLEPN